MKMKSLPVTTGLVLCVGVFSQACVPQSGSASKDSSFNAALAVFPMRDAVPTCDEAGDGMGAFGSFRSGGARKHAGCDLYNEYREPIYAIEDGVVIDGPYDFYCDTDALEVKHGERVIRYGEISKGSAAEVGMYPGKRIKKGDLIARVGLLSCYSQPMLHFEMFSGSVDGPLTNLGNYPFQRRSDLLNPTQLLMGAKQSGRLAGGSSRTNRTCNEDELATCKKNGGGFDCYELWGCEFPGTGPDCDKVQLLKCMDASGGDACFAKHHCVDRRKATPSPQASVTPAPEATATPAPEATAPPVPEATATP